MATHGTWPRLALAFGLAFLITGLPIFLHLVAQPLAIAFCVAAAIMVVRWDEQDIPIVVLTASIFQNVFVSLASSHFSDSVDIEPLKSYNFVTTVSLWLAIAVGFVKEPCAYSPFVRKLIVASVGMLAVVGVYFIGGLALNPRNAIIYVRNIGLPVLMFQMFLLVAAKHKLPLPGVMSALLILVAICGYAELLFTDLWLKATNGWSYLTLLSAKRLVDPEEISKAAQGGHVVTSVLDYASSTFLNIGLPDDLNFMVQRLQGPNFHPISFGYLLATLVAFAALHRRKLIAALAAPLLILTSAKGPLALIFGVLAIFVLARRRGSRTAIVTLAGVLLAYAIFAFRSGLSHGDYHVLGLLGGLNGFLKWPIGHSLGDGGNLSMTEFDVDWEKAQREGAADLAVESAVGVLFYQLGLAAAAVLLFYAWIVSIAWRLFDITRAPALALAGSAVAITLVNGIFQEEAYFAPLALGLVMAITGAALGATDRVVTKTVAGTDDADAFAASRGGAARQALRA